MGSEQMDLLDPWPYESVRLLVERRAAEALAEIKAMAESARRSIGQSSRQDHLRRRIERERLAQTDRPTLQQLANKMSAHRLAALATVSRRPRRLKLRDARDYRDLLIPPGHRPSGVSLTQHWRNAA